MRSARIQDGMAGRLHTIDITQLLNAPRAALCRLSLAAIPERCTVRAASPMIAQTLCKRALALQAWAISSNTMARCTRVLICPRAPISEPKPGTFFEGPAKRRPRPARGPCGASPECQPCHRSEVIVELLDDQFAHVVLHFAYLWDCPRALTFSVSLDKQAAGRNRQARRGAQRCSQLEGSQIQESDKGSLRRCAGVSVSRSIQSAATAKKPRTR